MLDPARSSPARPWRGAIGRSSGGSCQLPDPHPTLRAGNMCSKLNLETPDQYVKIVVVESDAQLNNHAQLDSVAMCDLKSRDGSAQIAYDLVGLTMVSPIMTP